MSTPSRDLRILPNFTWTLNPSLSIRIRRTVDPGAKFGWWSVFLQPPSQEWFVHFLRAVKKTKEKVGCTVCGLQSVNYLLSGLSQKFADPCSLSLGPIATQLQPQYVHIGSGFQLFLRFSPLGISSLPRQFSSASAFEGWGCDSLSRVSRHVRCTCVGG